MDSLLSQAELFETNFGAMDWFIVAVYLLVSVAVGVYANRYISNLSDFLVAGRSIRLYLGVATMTGTEIGLVTIMYQASDGFSRGLATLHVGIVWGAAALLIGLTGFIVYRLRAMGLMTIPEFYGKRFDTRVRWLGGLVLAGAGILNMGLFLRAGADFITAVTGLDSHGWLLVIMTGLMVLVLFYTIVGGMVSIVITDLIQFIVLSVGMIVVTVFVVSHIGWETIFRVAAEETGSQGLNPFAEESGYGTIYVVSMVLVAVSAASLWQSGTLRALSARSPRIAKRIYCLSSITFMARFVIPAFWGVCAFAFLALPENADLAARVAGTADAAEGMIKPIQAMPLMVGRVVPTIVLGVIVAAMVAAFMSTHDSYLLCWASVLTQDVVAPLVRGGLGDRGRIQLTRLFVLLQGVFLLYWGLWYPAPASLWDYMATSGAVYLSGASAVVVCGLYWRRASSAGALAAVLAGLVVLAPSFVDWRAFHSAEGAASWLTACLWWLEGYSQHKPNLQVIAFAASWYAMVLFSLLFPDARTEPRKEVPA